MSNEGWVVIYGFRDWPESRDEYPTQEEAEFAAYGFRCFGFKARVEPMQEERS